MKRFTLGVFLLVGALATAQNVEFEKANFPGKKDELKDALRKLESGTAFFEQGKKEVDDFRRSYFSSHKYYPVSLHDYQRSGHEDFRLSIAPLNDANRFNPNNARVNYMLGIAHFHRDPGGKDAIEHLEKAGKLNPQVELDQSFWLGWAYHLHGRWDEAISLYRLYLGLLQPRAKSYAAAIEDVQKKISECEVGKKLSATPERVFVDNLGNNVNSPYPEYGPAISTDEQTIFFTSRRANSMGGKRTEHDDGYYEDLYMSQKVDGEWQPAKQLSKNVNSEGHDATAGLSPDGSRLYVFRSTPSDPAGDLYETILFGLDWEPPVKMNRNINSKYHESTVSLSFDGKRLFFVSKKESGLGDGDIYYSDMDVNGEWGPSKNLGPVINTKYGEEGVFMHPDGVTLYFSSKGPGSMGGYDIFKSNYQNGAWSAPVNLGYPINGPDDDVFFVVSGSGNRAYFAAAKQGGYGSQDLYKITFLGPEKQPLLNSEDQLIAANSNPVSNLRTAAAVEIKSARLTILKGVVTDEKSGKPLEATIELVDNELNAQLATFKSNNTTGKYLVTLPSGRNYGIALKSPGYLFHSENFNIPDSAEYQEFVLDVGLKKLTVGSSIVLKNIFFDFDKATIRKESAAELDRMVKLMKDNITLKVEIGSHTDNIGSDDYNLRLSQERSSAVVSYLTSKGVPANRLTAQGYGETVPIGENNSEQGRQQNRRTEFKILSK